MIRLPALAASALLLAACSGTDPRLYSEDEPPRLRDGSITMYTYWYPGDEERREERVIRAREGRVSCSLQSPSRGRLEGEVPEGVWVRLWSQLLGSRIFEGEPVKIEGDDVGSGSPYHLVRLQLGDRYREFSAQLRRSFLVFSTKAVLSRLEHTNRIVDIVAEHASEQVAPPKEADTRPAEDGPSGPGPESTLPQAGGETGGS